MTERERMESEWESMKSLKPIDTKQLVINACLSMERAILTMNKLVPNVDIRK